MRNTHFISLENVEFAAEMASFNVPCELRSDDIDSEFWRLIDTPIESIERDHNADFWHLDGDEILRIPAPRRHAFPWRPLIALAALFVATFAAGWHCSRAALTGTESEISFATTDSGIELYVGDLTVDLSNSDALTLATDIAEHVR